MPRAVTTEDITKVIGALADAVDEALSTTVKLNYSVNPKSPTGIADINVKVTVPNSTVSTTVYGNGDEIPENSKVEFSYVLKNNAYEFVNWTDGTNTETNATYTIPKASSDINAVANFKLKGTPTEEFTVTFDDKYSVNNKVYATVTSAVYNDDNTVKATLNSGDKVAKGAKIKFSVNVNDNNYTFTNWNITNNGANSTDSNKTTNAITVNGNVTAKANFSKSGSQDTYNAVQVAFNTTNSDATQTVYSGSTNSVVYNIYAGLSNAQVDFKVVNNKNVAEVEFNLTAKKYDTNSNSSNSITGDSLTKLLNNLKFSKNNNNLIESVYVSNGKVKLTLLVDNMSSDSNNPNEITLNTEYDNISVSGSSLSIKVYKFNK